ncbi:MAG: NAD(P)H-hydrate dehydratase [Thermoplasmatales archaeon]
MLSLLDSRILDLNAAAEGLDLENIMEKAGESVAKFVYSLKPSNVLVVCGSGNNGGDGYVTARLLRSMGINVGVYQASHPSTELCKKKHDQYLAEGGVIADEIDFDGIDVIVDALLGVGISGEPREPYLGLIKKINSSGKTVVSVDVPSGFPSKTQVKADYTVTMQFPKEGMNDENSGKIIVVDVGFPRDIVEIIGPGDMLAFPESSKESHKGQNGISIIVSGSSEYFGAPIYVSKAALRMGVDLVFLFTPEKIHQFVACNAPDVILRKSGKERIEFNYSLMKTIEDRDASVAIGPGITKEASVMKEAYEIISYALSQGRKVVIDADALPVAKAIKDFGGNAVLTPHRGEFRTTFQLEPTEENVIKTAEKINAVILLKGPVDIVTDGEVVKRNVKFHHQSMTKGGTGDLITGSVAGLLSRGVDPLHASFLASYIIGSAGLESFNRHGYSYFTSDILDLIPYIITKQKKSS